jgi:hypothetical protein
MVILRVLGGLIILLLSQPVAVLPIYYIAHSDIVVVSLNDYFVCLGVALAGLVGSFCAVIYMVIAARDL